MLLAGKGGGRKKGMGVIEVDLVVWGRVWGLEGTGRKFQVNRSNLNKDRNLVGRLQTNSP